MWGLINPQIKDTINIEAVEKFLLDVSFLAIELPKDYYEHQLEEAEEVYEMSGHKEIGIDPQVKQ